MIERWQGDWMWEHFIWEETCFITAPLSCYNGLTSETKLLQYKTTKNLLKRSHCVVVVSTISFLNWNFIVVVKYRNLFLSTTLTAYSCSYSYSFTGTLHGAVCSHPTPTTLSDLNAALQTSVNGLSQIQYIEENPEALFWEHRLQADLLQLGIASENEQHPISSTKLLIDCCQDGFYDAETLNGSCSSATCLSWRPSQRTSCMSVWRCSRRQWLWTMRGSSQSSIIIVSRCVIRLMQIQFMQ